MGCTHTFVYYYRQSIPAFRYNAAVFPPYGDTKHHWFIKIYRPYERVLLSFVTDSKEKIFNCISDARSIEVELHFVIVPLPDILQYQSLY